MGEQCRVDKWNAQGMIRVEYEVDEVELIKKKKKGKRRTGYERERME